MHALSHAQHYRSRKKEFIHILPFYPNDAKSLARVMYSTLSHLCELSSKPIEPAVRHEHDLIKLEWAAVLLPSAVLFYCPRDPVLGADGRRRRIASHKSELNLIGCFPS